MNQFSAKDKEHLRRHLRSAEMLLKDFKKEDLGLLLQSQLSDAYEDYHYWKERLKDINKQLICLKQLKTKLYSTTEPTIYIIDKQTVTEKLFWYRNLYPKVLTEYRDAKQDYKFAQIVYDRHLQKERADRIEAKRFVGKFLYKIRLKQIDSDYKRDIYVRSDSDYLDENNFKDEFEYDLHLAVERFGDKLKEFSWNASWELSTIFKNLNDYEIDIAKVLYPALVDPKTILIDFAEFHAWRNKARVKECQRMTIDEFKATKEDNATGFGVWLVNEIGDVLEKQYIGTATEIVFYIKKTYRYWEKFYTMFKNGEKPSDRRKNK